MDGSQFVSRVPVVGSSEPARTSRVPADLQDPRRIKRRQRRIARFLAERQPETPCLVVDLETVAHAYRLLQWHLPLARIFYAVKANPAPEVVTTLRALGSSFDVASRG